MNGLDALSLLTAVLLVLGLNTLAIMLCINQFEVGAWLGTGNISFLQSLGLGSLASLMVAYNYRAD